MTRSTTKFALGAVAMVGTIAGAQQPATPARAPKPAPVPAAAPKTGGVAVSELDTWKGVVLAVNYETWNVTLRKISTGTLKSYTLTQEAANFMEVGQGDTVTVEVAISLAVYLRKASEPAAGAPASYMAVATKGKPVINNVAVQEVNGTVVQVNYL